MNRMCKKEIEEFDSQIKAYGEKVSSSKKMSEKFLYSIGVTTKNGNVSKNYKNLCIQEDRG